MVRVLATLLLMSWLLSCGTKPATGVQYWIPPEPGKAVFYLRYNLPTALLDRSDLGFEIKAGSGWERIAIFTEGDEEQALLKLQDLIEKRPNKILPVVAVLSPELMGWPGNHHCRRLTIVETDELKVDEWVREQSD